MLAVVTLFAVLAWAFSAAVTLAFWYGVAYLGGKVFGSDAPEAETGATPNAQSRSWNPRTTQQEGTARPRSWGKNLHHGNIVAKWTDVDGDDREILYLIVEHGDGPTKGIVEVDGVKQVFLNDQPAANFGSVDIQERLGTLGQTVMTGFEKTKLDYPENAELLLDDPIIVTTHNDFFDDIEYTILFPNGLLKYHKTGESHSSGLTLKVRIREHPAGGWTEIFNESISSLKKEPYFLLYKVNTLEPGYVSRGTQYDLEFTNLTGPSERHVNDVYLKSFREVIDIAFTRPGKALIGIRAVATSQLSGSLDVKVIREDKIINVWDGTDWELKYSRNRAWVVFDAFTQPVITGEAAPFAIDHYDGLNPSRLDLNFFYAWAQFCETQVPDGLGGNEDRLACDTILDFHTSVWTFANEIASVGRAKLYWQGHILTGWIDAEVSGLDITGLVVADNIMARSWESQWTEKTELAGKAEVFFNDSRQGYERTSAALPNENAGRYTKIISIEGIGITTRGTAIHLANHVLLRNELIRNINSFRQYKEAFRYKLGDVIRLQHRTPNWGVSYRVISSSANNKVKLDRTCGAVANDIIYIQSFDEPNGKVHTDSYTVVSVSGKVVTIAGTWDITPLKNYMVAIGELATDIQLRRITDMNFRSDNYVDVTVETYDTALFDADDLVPVLPDQNYIWKKPSNPLTRPVTRWDVIDMINELVVPLLDTDIPMPSNLTWNDETPDGDSISWSKTDIDENIIFRYKGTSYVIEPANTNLEFIYWDPDDSAQFLATDIAAVALAPGHWLVCTNRNGVAYPAVPMQLTHAAILLAGTIRAEQYLELRNTMVYNGDDSLDNSKPFTIPFKIVSEMTAIISAKLSFRIMPYRAYSTGASSGGASTSGSDGAQSSSGILGGPFGGIDTEQAKANFSGADDTEEAHAAFDSGARTDSEDGTGSHYHDLPYGSSEFDGHEHSFTVGTGAFSGHTHAIEDLLDHHHDISNHTHSTPNHTHDVTYGIHEESNSPTVHFHIDNGAGFGGASGNYNSDQLDIDISGSLSGTGWRNLRFDTDLRCRIFAIIELKLDITA